MQTLEGSCHCGAIAISLSLPGAPQEQAIGNCQCSFCRKHNARTYSHPKANATLTVQEAKHLQRYTFGLQTAESIVCRQCGVYVAMILSESNRAWSTINIDILDDRALFGDATLSKDFSAENSEDRIKRRKAQWIPTSLVGWP